ncbi:hypothetical protein IGK74_002412 [Enterococcus sp. AZ150]|uniref:HNH endonuclease n=1 Tax=Enterococcus sp. AZ150 TaxID=2774866 RepID=UPI003F1FB1B3
MQFVIIIILGILAIALFIYAFPFILALLGLYLVYRFIRWIRKNRYFNSEEFKTQKEKIDSTINEYNEISEYVKHIPNNNEFVVYDDKYEHAHLATFENTSKQNFKRNKHTKNLNSKNVRSVSLQIVRKASEEPIKYLCKYFDIKPTEENLKQLEQISENISRMENTLENLKLREEEIKNDFNPPKFILKYYKKELLEKLGANIPEISVEYVEYIFEYVSAGGNSSQKATITFDGRTVEAVANYVSQRIKYNKSAKAQRALMTESLRNKIKHRDNFTCQSCGISTHDQSLLLLEIDHIIPVSKGGLSTPDNLQTLCWKCNRTKSNKILVPET